MRLNNETLVKLLSKLHIGKGSSPLNYHVIAPARWLVIAMFMTCTDSMSVCFSWLKKQGLVARKLTILDALAPTMIPHSTKYVPILEKHVLSKVFDQVK